MKVLNFSRFWSLVITSIFIIGFDQFAESDTAWNIKTFLVKEYDPGIGPLRGVVRTNNLTNERFSEDEVLAFVTALSVLFLLLPEVAKIA